MILAAAVEVVGVELSHVPTVTSERAMNAVGVPRTRRSNGVSDSDCGSPAVILKSSVIRSRMTASSAAYPP